MRATRSSVNKMSEMLHMRVSAHAQLFAYIYHVCIYYYIYICACVRVVIYSCVCVKNMHACNVVKR